MEKQVGAISLGFQALRPGSILLAQQGSAADPTRGPSAHLTGLWLRISSAFLSRGSSSGAFTLVIK